MQITEEYIDDLFDQMDKAKHWYAIEKVGPFSGQVGYRLYIAADPPAMGSDLLHAPYWMVGPPNRLQRWFGITFEDKVEKARRKGQAYADKRNAEDDRARRALDGEPTSSRIKQTRGWRPEELPASPPPAPPKIIETASGKYPPAHLSKPTSSHSSPRSNDE